MEQNGGVLPRRRCSEWYKKIGAAGETELLQVLINPQPYFAGAAGVGDDPLLPLASCSYKAYFFWICSCANFRIS